MNEINNNGQNTQWEWGAETHNSDNNSWQQRYPNPYVNGQNYRQGTDYNNEPYYGHNAGYNYGQPYSASAPVTNVFFYILMVLTAISAFITASSTTALIRALAGSAFFSPSSSGTIADNYAAMYNYLVNVLANSPVYSFYSMLNSVLGFITFAFFIVDIVLVHKKGYPCLGLILFAILFKPGYFIWRAHVVHQKKLLSIIFTVCYVLFYALYFFRCLLFMVSAV